MARIERRNAKGQVVSVTLTGKDYREHHRPQEAALLWPTKELQDAYDAEAEAEYGPPRVIGPGQPGEEPAPLVRREGESRSELYARAGVEAPR